MSTIRKKRLNAVLFLLIPAVVLTICIGSVYVWQQYTLDYILLTTVVRGDVEKTRLPVSSNNHIDLIHSNIDRIDSLSFDLGVEISNAPPKSMSVYVSTYRISSNEGDVSVYRVDMDGNDVMVGQFTVSNTSELKEAITQNIHNLVNEFLDNMSR